MIHQALAGGLALLCLIAGIAGASASVPEGHSARSHGVPALARAAPFWQQVNDNGFGDPSAGEVSALEAFQGYLYAGTSDATHGARILRSQNGTAWTPVTQAGFGIPFDIAPPAILDLTALNGRLYASTGRGDGPGQIWRTLDGVNWAPMVITGFGDPDTVDVTALAVYDGLLYAAATDLTPAAGASGAQIWCSFTGDNNTWTQQVVPGIAGTETARITGFAAAEFDGGLYAAVESNAPAQIWRSYGNDWAVVVSDGFGGNPATATGGMASFAGYLYVGAGNARDGAQLWRTADGETWEPTIIPGFGDPNHAVVEAVFVFQGYLYVSAKNTRTGMELWRSSDGAHWEQIAPDGFGDSHNAGTNASNAVASFLGHLYVGTSNTAEGGELWRMSSPQYAYLPLILHQP